MSGCFSFNRSKQVIFDARAISQKLRQALERQQETLSNMTAKIQKVIREQQGAEEKAQEWQAKEQTAQETIRDLQAAIRNLKQDLEQAKKTAQGWQKNEPEAEEATHDSKAPADPETAPHRESGLKEGEADRGAARTLTGTPAVRKTEDAVATSSQFEPGKNSSARIARKHSAGRPFNDDSYMRFRNIMCAGNSREKAARLDVYSAPDGSSQVLTSIAFAEVLYVKSEQHIGSVHWLEVAGSSSPSRDGLVEGGWVQAQAHGVVNCAKLTGNEEKGRPLPAEYRGQHFGRMYSEGYDGRRDVVVLSASGQAFWVDLNRTCLLRDIGTSTVFEKDWVNSGDAFDDWVAFYAVNVWRYALANGHKQMLVTVKPTDTWRRYAGEGTSVLNADDVKADIGRAQYAECRWIYSMCKKLEFRWEDVTFITALSFLRKYGNWSRSDCMKAALEQVQCVHESFESLPFDWMESELFTQLYCVEEAFDAQHLKADLEDDGDGRSVTSGARAGAPDLQAGQPVDESSQLLAQAKVYLRRMHTMWSREKQSFELAMKEAELTWDAFEDSKDLMGALLKVAKVADKDGMSKLTQRILEKLKQKGLLISAAKLTDSAGSTPLHLEAECGRSEIATALVGVATSDAGEVLLKGRNDGRTVLHIAADESNAELADALFTMADRCRVQRELLLQQDSSGYTALHGATKSGSAELRKGLLAAAARLSAERELLLRQAGNGQTALHLAAKNSSAELVEALLDAAAGLGAERELLLQRDGDGQTALHLAAKKDVAEPAEALLAAAAGLGVERELLLRQRKDGCTALQLVAFHGLPSVAKELLSRAAAAEALSRLLRLRADDGRTPLQVAESESLHKPGRKAVVPMLREALRSLPIEHVERGAYAVRECEDPELIIVAAGSDGEVSLCVDAAAEMSGRRVRVVSMLSTDIFRGQPEPYKDAVMPRDVPTLSVEAAITKGWSPWAKAYIGIDVFGNSVPGGLDLGRFGFNVPNVVACAEKCLGGETGVLSNGSQGKPAEAPA
uniref:Transketolase-like C-terminal domain-containing protein n=1 Tax=Alexandrium monilatum TaxID=311494 RepID=A0A7S4RTU8_9DINO